MPYSALEERLNGRPLGTLGERLAACIWETRLTVAELALITGTHPQTIRAVLAGRRVDVRAHTATAWARAFADRGLPVTEDWLRWRGPKP